MNNSLSRPNATVAQRQASLNLVWGSSKQIDELPFKLFKKLRSRHSRAFPEDVYHRSQPGSGSDPSQKREVVWGSSRLSAPGPFTGALVRLETRTHAEHNQPSSDPKMNSPFLIIEFNLALFISRTTWQKGPVDAGNSAVISMERSRGQGGAHRSNAAGCRTQTQRWNNLIQNICWHTRLAGNPLQKALI